MSRRWISRKTGWGIYPSNPPIRFLPRFATSTTWVRLHGWSRGETHMQLGKRSSAATTNPMLEPNAMPQNPIMLADDSEDDEVLFRRSVRLSGLANPVIVVRDGDEVVAYLSGEGPYADRERHPLPKVLMLDLKMPRKNGFEVLQWIKQQPHLKELLVIVLTNSDLDEDKERSRELGAQSVLAKPCSVEDLKQLAAEFPGSWTGSS